MSVNINAVNLAIIIFYLVGIVGLGCWTGLRSRKDAQAGKDYFLAGGTLTWPIIGLALFSTNISTIHLVAFAQEGYDNGLGLRQLRVDGAIHADHHGLVLRAVLHPIASRHAARLSSRCATTGRVAIGWRCCPLSRQSLCTSAFRCTWAPC